MLYKIFIPAQAVGANLVYFDLFNAGGTGTNVYVNAVIPLVSGSTAVVGTLGVDLFLTRTTAIGTGGTAATLEGTSLTAMTISAQDSTQTLPSSISARLSPSGGATAGAVLSWRSVFTEETASAAYSEVLDMVVGQSSVIPPLLVPKGTGVRVVQGSVASVGNIGFGVYFSVMGF